MQSEIQLFYKKENNSSLEVIVVTSLSALMQELGELEKNKNLTLIINVGEKRLKDEEVLDLFHKQLAKVLLTESAFFALSEFFLINSAPVRGPFLTTYGTSLYRVNDKIYQRLISRNNFQIKSLSTENSVNQWTYNGITKTWLIDYLRQYPEDVPILNSNAIINDLSYQLNECNLTKETRLKLGRHRSNFLIGLKDFSNIENLVPLMPPWTYQAEVSKYLEVDVRCKNCLNAAGIKFFFNFFNFTDHQLLRVPNFGRSSYTKLRMGIVNAVYAYINASSDSPISGSFIQEIINDFYEESVIGGVAKLKPEFLKNPYNTERSFNESNLINWNPDDFKNGGSSSVPRNNELLSIVSNKAQEANRSFATLQDCLNYFSTIDIKKPNYQKCFIHRMGITSKPKSLQEVGELIGLTRERVRQIEKKILIQFENKYKIREQLICRLDSIRLGLAIPLTITGLSSFDKWFDGFENRPWLLESLFSAVGVENYRLHSFDNELIIAPGDHDLIGATIRSVKQMILERFENGLTESDIKEFTSSLIGFETPELIDTVVYEATKNIAFDSDVDKKVLFVGSKVAATIANILASSNIPMNCHEITNILRNKYGIDGEVNYFRNICNTSFYQYAPSTFGLLKHSNLSNDEIYKISDYCFNIIIDGGAGKQWHCDKLLDLLIEEDTSFKDKLDKYKLRVCLIKSEKFIDLGRMTFVIKTEEAVASGIKRIEISDFIEAILEKSPTPMHKEAIYKIIEQNRGLGDCAQIFHSGRLVSTAPGTWGLMDKHLNLSEADFKDITFELVSILQKKQFGLTEAELLNEILEDSKSCRFKDNPYILFSLGIKSKSCRREDIYLTLSEWDDCRRATLRGSVIKALEESQFGAMKLKQILDIAEGYYLHSIEGAYAKKILIENNFFYDEQIQAWKRDLN